MLNRLEIGWTSLQSKTCGRGFLDLVGPREKARFEPHLEVVNVVRGATLFASSDRGEHIFFPQGPLISLEQHNRVEVAVVGSEGMVGWHALVGCSSSPFGAIVRGRDGVVLKLRTEILVAILADTPALGLIVHSFVNVISVQMGETIGALASHRIDMRLARWILLRHDRVGGDEIIVQHDEIAENLGARRASITDCLHVIEGEGLVRCKRGRIIVLDRCGLEAVAANCYGAAENFYRNAIGGFGKIGVANQSLAT
jgi:CRP-like cAMP-binding protein